MDDTDLCIMVHPSNDAAAMAKHMQGSVTNWEGLLQAMSRTFVPNKCFGTCLTLNATTSV